MIITKEQQEAWVSNYIKGKHTQDECIGFIDGVEKVMSVISSAPQKQLPDVKNAIQPVYFLALMYAGTFVDQGKLGKGIYSKQIPDLHPIGTTIPGIGKDAKKSQIELGKKYIPDSYFENLNKCELVRVVITV